MSDRCIGAWMRGNVVGRNFGRLRGGSRTGGKTVERSLCCASGRR